MADLIGTSVKEFNPGAGGPVKEIGLSGSRVTEIGAEEPRTEEEWEYPELRDWEKEFAEKATNVYATARVLADFIPYLRYGFPSGRDEFARRTTGGQTLELMIEMLGLAGVPLIGKGVKVAAKGLIAAGRIPGTPVYRALPKFLRPLPEARVMANPFGDEIMSSVSKYQHKTLGQRLAEHYGLEADEAAALLKGEKSVWRPLERSRAWSLEETDSLTELFTKEGKVSKKVLKNIANWIRPREEQELGHYAKQVDRVFERVTRGTKYSVHDVFKAGAVRVYGEAGEKITLGNASLDQLGNVMKDVLEHGARYRRVIDITAWSQIKPVRKVLGEMDAIWGTTRNFFKPVKALFKNTGIAKTNYVKVWWGMLAGKELNGKPLLSFTTDKFGIVKLTENYSRKELKAAGQLAADMDIAQAAGKPVSEVQALMDIAPVKVQMLAKTLHEWYDWMYSDLIKTRIPQLFDEVGLTKLGKRELDAFLNNKGELVDVVNKYLLPGNNFEYKVKQLALQAALKRTGEFANIKNLQWFTEKALKDLTDDELKGLTAKIKDLGKKVKMRVNQEDLGFPNYLENYTARLPKEILKPWTPEGGIPSEMTAGFMQPRKVPVPKYETRTSINELIETRARMQAKGLQLYPFIDQYKEFVKGLPTNLKAYSTHWVNRVLGVPSPVDLRTANLLSRFSLRGWDQQRVVQVAQTIIDLTYMGGIGFKPFSVMRNYIQPILTTPADMGGVKDIIWTCAGMKKAWQPSHRVYIREIGAIQEFTPDLVFGLKSSKYSESSLQKLRDMSLWMFKCSDHHCRYWSGGAAVAKWDYWASRLGKDGFVRDGMVDAFKSRMKVSLREKVVAKEIDSLLKLGTAEAFAEAKKSFVLDVCANSNFLYGMLESPLIGYTWGAPGRVSLVFQSWWMNYADNLAQWLYHTPEVGGKAISATNERLFTFMLSSAIAYEIMEPLWGKRTAATSVLAGPLPLQLSIPPTWKPFFDGIQMIAGAVPESILTQDLEPIRNRAIQTLKDVAIFAPGGIQTYQMIQGARKEGLEGVIKSIIKYKQDKEKED